LEVGGRKSEERLMPLFGRRKRDDDLDEVVEAPHKRSAADAYVPASAIAPEKQRMAIYDGTDEEADEEIEFLSEIAAQVERDQRTPRRRAYSPPRVEHIVVAEEQALEVAR
jgi:hypothetical protein